MIRHLQRLTGSKLAIMDGSGYIATVGNCIEEQGLLFSNDSYTKEFSAEIQILQHGAIDFGFCSFHHFSRKRKR